jgi:acyl carrier protein
MLLLVFILLLLLLLLLLLVFVPLTAMPLTPNGKIDRTKLPFPDTFAISQEKRTTPARNPIEAKLADIWSTLLGLRSVDVFDNFFDIGGHSILATRLIFQLRQEFRVELPLNMLFDNPTVATMAQAITVQIGDSGIVHQGNAAIAPAHEKGCLKIFLLKSFCCPKHLRSAHRCHWFLGGIFVAGTTQKVPTGCNLLLGQG